MAFANRFHFRFDSIHGVEYNIYILQDGYSGACAERRLGRAPVLKKQKNGPIRGTSLEIYAEAAIDGEFATLYTSDPKEFRVDLYRAGSIIWTGFVSTELYSEPSIYPPYDVQIVATDGLGELKLNKYVAQGEVSLKTLFADILAYTGSDRAINIAWAVSESGESAPDLLSGGLIDIDYMDGESLYDVLVYLLESFNATITAYNGSWLIMRETDLPSSGTSLSVLRIAAGGGNVTTQTISDVSKSVGQMGVADMWPEGHYSTSIVPARKSVSLCAPWHLANIFANPNIEHESGQPGSGWTLESGSYYVTNKNWIMLGGSIGAGFTYMCQSFVLPSLTTGLSIIVSAANKSGAPTDTAEIGVYAIYETANETYYGDNLGWLSSIPAKPRVTSSMAGYEDFSDYENIIPNPKFNVPGTLTVYITGHNAYVNHAIAEMATAESGYRDRIFINNGARGEDREIEIIHGRILSDEVTFPPFLTGAIKKVSGTDKVIIYKYDDSVNTDKDFLALAALSYAQSVADCRLKQEGVIDIPSNILALPIFFDFDGVRHTLETYEWDLLKESASLSAISLPAASITVDSESVTPLEDDYTGPVSGSSGHGSSGGSSGGGGGARQFFEVFEQTVNIDGVDTIITSVKLKDEYAGLSVGGFLVAYGDDSGDEPGGGIDLDRVWESLTNNTDKPNVKINGAHIPTLSVSGDASATITVGADTIGIALSIAKGTDAILETGTDTNARLWSAKTLADYISSHGGGSYSEGTGISISGDTIAINSTYRNYISTAYNAAHSHSNKSTLDGISASDITNWNAAYGWGDHSGLYLPISGGTLTGDLRLKTNNANYGSKLRFGDADYCYLHEDDDDHLTIYADKGITISTGSNYGISVQSNVTLANGKTFNLGSGTLSWDSTKSCWKLTGNLLVTGTFTALGD